jgi:hypothetical protein
MDRRTFIGAFLQEHRRCGDLNAGVEPALVWMTCDCGAELVRPLDKPSKDKQSCRPGAPRQIPGSLWRLGIPVTERGLGSGPAYSRYFKQIAKAVGLPRP